MTSARKGKISYTLLALNILPLLFFGLLILLLGTHCFTQAMYDEVETELSNVTSNLITMFDAMYPGDYRLVGDTSYQLYKGDQNLTHDYTLIDRIKQDTELEVSLFYQDTRVLTTITEKSGSRIIGSGAPSIVLEDVFSSGECHFYNKTIIYGGSYFSYYAPLFNRDGTVVGMFAVCKPSDAVDASVQASVRPLFIADILFMLIASLFTCFYTNRFASSLLQIHTFLRSVSTGNLNARLSPALLGRNDELGEIAHSALNMQHSLHVLIEQDSLTLLLNRRCGDERLHAVAAAAAEKGLPFCVAIGDIDFFKGINDTYGHACGDAVLKKVSSLLRSHMNGKGFVSRWGGEEFLLVYENTALETAAALLEELLNELRSSETVYDDHVIIATMTFGLAAGGACGQTVSPDVTELLRIADEKLYQGKEAGRNRIVF